jgi:hypothetical protein
LSAGKLGLFYPIDGMERDSFMRILLADAVGTIFWTLPIIGPMLTNVPPISPLASEERNRGNMTRKYLAFVAAGLLICLAAGCAVLDPPCDENCPDNGPRGHCHHAAAGAGAADDQTGVVAYPYYTNRGPRDYFSKPTDIGP